MGVKSSLSARAYHIQPMVRQFEESRLLELGRTYNGYRLGHHPLPGEVGVQVHAGQKRCLCRVGVYPAQSDDVVLVLVEDELFFILHVTTVMAACLLWHKQVGDVELALSLLETKVHRVTMQIYY